MPESPGVDKAQEWVKDIGHSSSVYPQKSSALSSAGLVVQGCHNQGVCAFASHALSLFTCMYTHTRTPPPIPLAYRLPGFVLSHAVCLLLCSPCRYISLSCSLFPVFPGLLPGSPLPVSLFDGNIGSCKQSPKVAALCSSTCNGSSELVG